ncbi:unnamed protein product, partial [Brenthis ino]
MISVIKSILCPSQGLKIFGDLSLRSVVGAMLRDERSWSAMVSFSEAVISLKETAEREREANALADPLRRRRLGERRRRYAHLLPPP